MVKYIASVSWGKDSLAMLLGILERGMPLDEVIFYDTGMEFQAIYNMRDRMLPILAGNHIEYVELYPDYNFLYQMFEKPVKGKNGLHYGYSWCGGTCRWGTTDKIRKMDQYAESQEAIVYIAIAADEERRLVKKRKDYKRFPLSDWGMTEHDALDYCYKHGFDWLENGRRLYDYLDHVSCWCCTNKNLRELENIYLFFPEYWEKLKALQSRTERPMKGERKSVFDLEERFARNNWSAA